MTVSAEVHQLLAAACGTYDAAWTAALHAVDRAVDGCAAFARDIAPQVEATKKPKVPQPGEVNLPKKLNTKVGELMGIGVKVFYSFAFFAFLGAAGKMFWSHHRSGGEASLAPTAWVAAGCLLGGSAAALADLLIF
jgi:hypothetical protein